MGNNKEQFFEKHGDRIFPADKKQYKVVSCNTGQIEKVTIKTRNMITGNEQFETLEIPSDVTTVESKGLFTGQFK